MGWERDYENWRDEMHCGSRLDRPRAWTEAEVGATYQAVCWAHPIWNDNGEVVDYEVLEEVVCTEENKSEIERVLNDPEADYWGYRRKETL